MCAYDALYVTQRSIALELNVIMVISPACLYADEAWGHYAEWCGSTRAFPLYYACDLSVRMQTICEKTSDGASVEGTISRWEGQRWREEGAEENDQRLACTIVRFNSVQWGFLPSYQSAFKPSELTDEVGHQSYCCHQTHKTVPTSVVNDGTAG